MSSGDLIDLMDRDEAVRMDEELVGMARSQTVVRLVIGEAFVALGSGYHELGFARFSDYVRERCVRSGRWGEDSRTLAGRLATLPRIREQLLGSRIGWCTAELLARHATAEDEAELLEATRGMKVRQLREVLRERGGDGDPEGGEEVPFGTMDRRIDPLEAWMLQATIPMIELLDGRREPGSWMEPLLAEAQCALTNFGPHVDVLPEDVAERHRAFAASIQAGVERVARREERAESALPPMPPASPGVIEPLPEGALAIDRVILRELGPRLASCDLRFGELAARFFRGRGWRLLGFASEAQYARERLGTSRSAVRGRITLWRRSMRLEPIADAVSDARIGWEAASLIARVATVDTVDAWVDRATRRTFKHLREEVSAVELMKRMMHTDEDPTPPTEEEIAIVLALERDMKCGAYARRAFGMEREDDAPQHLESAMAKSSGVYAEVARAARSVEHALRTVVEAVNEGTASMTSEEAEAACLGVIAPPAELPTIDLEDDIVSPSMVTPPSYLPVSPEPQNAEPADGASAIQMSVDSASDFDLFAPRTRGSILARLRGREDLLLQWRMLEAAHARAGIPGSFVHFLVLSFWGTWAPTLGRTNACEAILRRDGYECTCPVCTRPSAPGTHHVVFRSRGGGDEPTNQTSPCDWCHLDGVHCARLKVSGDAPDLVWLIGRTPIMEVRGRERRLLR